MARSLKKGPFCDHHLMAKVEEAVASNNNKAVIKTWYPLRSHSGRESWYG